MPPCPGTLIDNGDGTYRCSRGLSCLAEELLRHQDARALAGQILEAHENRG